MKLRPSCLHELAASQAAASSIRSKGFRTAKHCPYTRVAHAQKLAMPPLSTISMAPANTIALRVVP